MKDHRLAPEEENELLLILQKRFGKNMHRHPETEWTDVQKKLQGNQRALWSLFQMEETGGEPDVISYDREDQKYIIADCSKESPKGRRSLCYDPQALESRKKHKPKDSAIGMARDMGIELLDEKQYFQLQKLEKLDTKTSSWLRTPSDIRDLGGAIFGDWRFGRVFIYHNGAESYYSSRGFRGFLKI